jgi:chorismate mutase
LVPLQLANHRLRRICAEALSVREGNVQVKMSLVRTAAAGLLFAGLQGTALIPAPGSPLGLAAGPAGARAAPSSALIPLVDDAAARLQTADPVAASKYRIGGAVDDPDRENQVIDAVTADADARHLDTGYVHDVFRDQIDATDSVEHSRFAQWKIDPGHAPTSAPELSASRDTIDALNRAMVGDIATLWAALHAPSCPTELRHALTAVTASRHLDEVFQQTLAYATHRYCG